MSNKNARRYATKNSHHRESRPTQGPCNATEVLSGRGQGRLQREVNCSILCSQKTVNHRFCLPSLLPHCPRQTNPLCNQVAQDWGGTSWLSGRSCCEGAEGVPLSDGVIPKEGQPGETLWNPSTPLRQVPLNSRIVIGPQSSTGPNLRPGVDDES